MNVGNRTELNTWQKIKEALIQCFADRRDLDCIMQELTRTRPFKNENLITFVNRLLLLKSQTIERISNNLNLSEIDQKCQINQCEKTALNTFIAGYSGTIRNNMYLKKPSSLEDAMAYVYEFENFEKLYGQFYEPRIWYYSNSNSTNNTTKNPGGNAAWNVSSIPLGVS
ncbi:uncharacterized protein LOC130900279 [Diorhabda carinulata]|uniref:uncharacterized protein LOC130900279 n=1 Tax=Diorhabda carinulata TaxID=1163345 RepID=UPI0025A27B11|nr:uncharacterized protein LOC130900279 [Diorhabda carinulata]